MQAERDMIVQNILPRLNHELQKNFVRVTFVDLRWGVTSHESESCKAIQCTCLNEIERCVEISPTSPHPCPSYPWFVCLRTKRKGWVMDEVNEPKDFEKPERFGWIENEGLGVDEASTRVVWALHELAPELGMECFQPILASLKPEKMSPQMQMVI
ncbi:MAG: hypothetical protein ACPIOQ_01145 [Promethearchaeia archaeon]